jgi:hypothetical protein
MTGYYVTLPALALAAFATTSVAQDAPPGAQATGCDVGSFSAVVSERTGEVLYWTNPTCPAASGPSDSPASDDAPAGLDMGDRNGSGSEGEQNGRPSVEER